MVCIGWGWEVSPETWVFPAGKSISTVAAFSAKGTSRAEKRFPHSCCRASIAFWSGVEKGEGR